MSQYVKCPCQNCNKGIEFDVDQLGQAKTATVPCPHCGMDTVIFAPQEKVQKQQVQSQAARNIQITIPNLQSFEAIIFWITRKFSIFWAAVVVLLIALFTVGFLISLWPSGKTSTDDTPHGIVPLVTDHPFMQNLLEYFVGISFLLAILTFISIVLVLFSIERNTRPKN